MTAHWHRVTLLVGEYLLLAPVAVVGSAYWLARHQLPRRSGSVCFFASLPIFLYAWMLGFLFTGGGI